MDDTQVGQGRLLTPGEVAAMFRVDPKTVTRWATAGRIGSIRTPGGHRRFREDEVRALLRGPTTTPAAAPAAPAAAAPASPASPASPAGAAAQIPAQQVPERTSTPR